MRELRSQCDAAGTLSLNARARIAKAIPAHSSHQLSEVSDQRMGVKCPRARNALRTCGEFPRAYAISFIDPQLGMGTWPATQLQGHYLFPPNRVRMLTPPA